jgi:sec-independent protein translocase protein TatC
MSERKGLVDAIRQKGKNLEAEMSFFDHLDVLRKHLIRSAIAIVLFTCLAWYYNDFIYNEIILGPKHPDFWTYRMMCLLDTNLHALFGDICVKQVPFTLINTEVAGQFTMQMNSSLMAGLILGVPYLLFEIWRFVKPGLTDKERAGASGFVLFASILFMLGVAFGYFIICPLSINFLANFTVSKDIQNTFTVDSYLSSIATLTLGTGIVFELPVVIFILSKLGIMTPKFMRSTRRYAIVLILIIAAIVTPTPDIMTMMAVALPLFLLYELSIMISSSVEKRRKKRETEFFGH